VRILIVRKDMMNMMRIFIYLILVSITICAGTAASSDVLDKDKIAGELEKNIQGKGTEQSIKIDKDLRDETGKILEDTDVRLGTEEEDKDTDVIVDEVEIKGVNTRLKKLETEKPERVISPVPLEK